jgi:UTP--glucose-1-phosphate uridylyltransferase
MSSSQRIYGYEYQDKRYDVGEVSGFVKATIDFALNDPSISEEIGEYLQQLTRGGMPHEQQA